MKVVHAQLQPRAILDQYGSKNLLKIVRVHTACRVITHGSSGLWPLQTPLPAWELNMTGSLVINPSDDNEMVQIC